MPGAGAVHPIMNGPLDHVGRASVRPLIPDQVRRIARTARKCELQTLRGLASVNTKHGLSQLPLCLTERETGHGRMPRLASPSHARSRKLGGYGNADRTWPMVSSG